MIFKILTSIIIYFYISVCYSDNTDEIFKKLIMNIPINNGISIINNEGNKYVVSISYADIKNSTPNDKVNAIETAKILSENNISKFINGENVATKESLKYYRIKNKINGENNIVLDNDSYDEIINNKSSGAIRNMKTIKWNVNSTYYVATLYELTNK